MNRQEEAQLIRDIEEALGTKVEIRWDPDPILRLGYVIVLLFVTALLAAPAVSLLTQLWPF